MNSFRVLGNSDTVLLEEFLAPHRDSSMFLRSNAHRAGLEYRGEVLQAIYVAAFRNEKVIGVAAHSWSGMLLVQAPEATEDVVRECVERSGRRVTGFAGPLDQVRLARHALGLANAETRMDGDEGLYALNLSDLVVPEALSRGDIEFRAPRADERDTLCQWRIAYDIETLGAADSDETRERATKALDTQIAAHNAWVAVERGRMVSLSAFNATLPDIVQLGGIYTPPELRGRGYARAAVAGSLLAARERGAGRAVLFTGNPSAIRSYQAIGFSRLGDFGLVLLR
ncbi:MAG TPA: GNAT family N-acetyltransferase [Terriglobia bacterium]|nr:GNAT family N-acetyltransferase [Terriglobia bacterium]